MARFITLHKEILNGGIKIVDVHVNVDQITQITEQSGSRFTFIGLTGGFVDVKESTEEVMKIIRATGCRSLRGE